MTAKKKRKTKPSLLPSWVEKWAGLIACVITFFIFLNSVFNGFVNWDDQEYVLNNQYITSLSFENISYLFSNENASNYHPLTMMSLAINYSISGLNAWSYHLTNLGLHIGNVFLVFILGKKLFPENIFVAFIISLLFGIHPMHVESVAWISERKDVLYVLFFLLALIQYLKYLDQKKIKFLFLVGLFFLLSLFSKPAAITFPPVLILIDWFRGRRDWMRLIIEKIPFILLAILFTFITYQIQEKTAVKTYDALGIVDRVSLGGTALSIYIFKAIFPINLNCFYAFPKEILSWMVFAALTSTIFLGGWIYYFRNKKEVLFGSLFFLLTIGLYVHIISFGEALLSERYTYLSYFGIFVLIAFFFDFILKGKYKRLGSIFITAYIILLCVVTFFQNRVWKSGETLWASSIKNMMIETAKPYINLASAQIKNTNKTDAFINYEKALSIDPNSFDALHNSAIIYANRQNYNEAISRYTRALQVRSQEAGTYVARGNAYFRIKNYKAAESDYSGAISLDPNYAEAYNNRGTINYNINANYQNAFSDFSNAIRLNPEFGSAFLNRSRCQYQLGRFKEALSDTEKAIGLGINVDASYLQQIRNNIH